jgi:hypothetical protein
VDPDPTLQRLHTDLLARRTPNPPADSRRRPGQVN